MSKKSTELPKDRRTATRLACQHPCLVRFDRRHFDGRSGSIGAQGTVVNLSASGVGLLLRSALPPGTTLVIGPLGAEAPSLPPASVVHCVPIGKKWRHGCGLQRRLNEEELSAWLS